MPEESGPVVKVAGMELSKGFVQDLGHLTCTEEDVVAFAKFVDPLPLHVDSEYAKRGLFGGIVASGAQLYIEFHKRWFVPNFGYTVLCGLGINNWNFMQPHLPGVDYSGRIQILELAPRTDKGNVLIHWHYAFFGPEGSMVQEIEVRVLHRLDSTSADPSFHGPVTP